MPDPVALFAPGIYFDMPAEAYHADPALGGTDMNLLARDPVEYQYRRLIPEKEETAALLRGRAQHSRCLEGVEAFNKAFKQRPEKTDYPEPVLDTVDDLREYALGIGIDKLPRLKDDIIDTIRLKDRSVTIWAEIMRHYDADPRQGLSTEIVEAVEQAAEWMQADPLLGEVMEGGSFSGGAPEVSVFWEEDGGVRCKCRFDYLYPHAIVDLKTFSSWRDKSIAEGAINAIVSYRYDLAAAHYLRGWRAAREMWLSIDHANWSPKQRGLCDAAFDSDITAPKWIWVFLKSVNAPQPIVLEWTRELSPFTYGAAEDEVASALERYRALRLEFGTEKQWPPRHAAVRLDDTSWPPWFGRREPR